MATTKLTESDLRNYIRNEVEKLTESNKATGFDQALNKSSISTTPLGDQGKVAAGAIAALVRAGGNLAEAKGYADHRWGNSHKISKALAASDFVAGGAILPQEVSSEIIELLRPQSAVRRMNPRTMNLDSGRLEVPRLDAGGAANWLGENVDIPTSEQEFGQVVLDAKKLAALTPISNDLIRDARQDVLDIVRDDLVRTMGTEEDTTFLTSSGTSAQPTGLRHLADSSTVTATNGTSAANIEADFKDLINALRTNNIPMTNPFFVMSARSFLALINLRDSTGGDLVFPQLRESAIGEGRVYGIPVIVSNNIPDDLGTGSDESLVFLVDASQVLLGQAGTLEVRVSDQASYAVSGSQVSTFERDQSLVRVISRVDLNVRHPKSIAVKTGIKWS